MPVVEDDEEEGSGVEIDAGIESGIRCGLEVTHKDIDLSVRRRERLSAVSFKCASRVFISIPTRQQTVHASSGSATFQGPSRVSWLLSLS